MAARRIVVFPQGQPASAEHRERCASFYIRHGGDVSRVIDGPFTAVLQCMDRVRRIGAIVSGEEHPIVIFSQSNPLALLLNARRTMETVVPALREAMWVILVDVAQDPFFESNARELGNLVSSGPEPTFDRPDGASFIILYASPTP